MLLEGRRALADAALRSAVGLGCRGGVPSVINGMPCDLNHSAQAGRLALRAAREHPAGVLLILFRAFLIDVGRASDVHAMHEAEDQGGNVPVLQPSVSEGGAWTAGVCRPGPDRGHVSASDQRPGSGHGEGGHMESLNIDALQLWNQDAVGGHPGGDAGQDSAGDHPSSKLPRNGVFFEGLRGPRGPPRPLPDGQVDSKYPAVKATSNGGGSSAGED